MSDNSKPAEDGFELATGQTLPDGTVERQFYRWHVTDGGKDLLLIDRFTGMPVTEFFELIEDNFDRGRAPVLLALMATSIRNRHQDWSVERIIRTVMNVNLSDVVFVDADTEEDSLPPASEGNTPSTPTGSGSSSPEPRSPASPAESETSETSNETQE